MSDTPKIQTPNGLLERILSRLMTERQLAAMRTYLPWVGLGFIFGLLASIPAWLNLFSEVGRSGFFQYVGLFFTDFRVVIDNWQDYGLSLLESLPTMSLALILLLLLGLILSLRFIQNYFRIKQQIKSSR